MPVRSTIIPLLAIAAVIALEEGDRCSVNELRGICVLRSACPELKQMQQLGVRPKICGYTANREKIFCCPRLEPLQQTRRPSEQYCEQYRKLASTEVNIGALSLDPDNDRRVWVPKCDESIGLIVGGTPASPKEFPHVAALGWIAGDESSNGKYDFRCGGSLISDRYVLTAAHCVLTQEGPPKVVRLGDYNLLSGEDGFTERDYDVEQIIPHPGYKPSQTRYNDIALLKLNQTVEFGPTIRPACLWTSADPLDRKAIAIGYGAAESNGNFTNVLMKVGLDLLDYVGCSIYYFGTRKLPLSTIESQICAHTEGGGKDTCHGDSGGPLQITTKGHNCLYYVVGVTSFGIACGGDVPGGYTKVAAFVDWIEPIVWPAGQT